MQVIEACTRILSGHHANHSTFASLSEQLLSPLPMLMILLTVVTLPHLLTTLLSAAVSESLTLLHAASYPRLPSAVLSTTLNEPPTFLLWL